MLQCVFAAQKHSQNDLLNLSLSVSLTHSLSLSLTLMRNREFLAQYNRPRRRKVRASDGQWYGGICYCRGGETLVYIDANVQGL
jgi:hypothetical protein